jgi:hypothetical protein
MAMLATDGDELIVRLSALEKLAAFRDDVRVPLGAVTDVEVEPDPWGALRGIRAPGTGWPGVIAYGVRRWPGGKDFAAVLRRRPALRIELGDASPFARVLVTLDNPDASAQLVREAVATAGGR